jgi:hypothetical protein
MPFGFRRSHPSLREGRFSSEIRELLTDKGEFLNLVEFIMIAPWHKTVGGFGE